MTAGLGQQPVGIGPFGVGLPMPESPAPTPALPSSRKLVGGQYVYTDGSNPDGDSDARQLVMIAVGTVLGSSSVATLGRGAEPKDIGANFVTQKRDQLKAALADLVKRRVVSIDSIDVETKASVSVTALRLVDLTTNEPLKVTIE